MATLPPEARFQVGAITASVFVNENVRADGSTFTARNTVLQRTYRTEDGSYRTTGSLDVADLPKAILALGQAYFHCVAGSRPAADGNSDE